MSEETKVEAKAATKEEVSQKKADRLKARMEKKAEALKNRIHTFSASVDDTKIEQFVGVLESCRDKEPKDLTDLQKTALSFLLLKKGQPIHWKDHIKNWNATVIDPEVMSASVIGDPSYARTHGNPDEKGFSLRRQLHLAQGNRRHPRYENFPLRVINQTVLENTRSHQYDRNQHGDEVPARQRLKEITLPDEMFDAISRQRKLSGELRAKFFKE